MEANPCHTPESFKLQINRMQMSTHWNPFDKIVGIFMLFSKDWMIHKGIFIWAAVFLKDCYVNG